MRLADYAFLLLPVEGDSSTVVVEAPVDWSFEPTSLGDADFVVWGRVPFRSPPGWRQLLGHVYRREKALRALNRGFGRLSPKRVHRLAPPPGPPGRIGARVRDFLLGGAAVELATAGSPDPVIEAVAREADIVLEWSSFSPGSDRAATARGRRGSQPVILRAGPTGTPSDPGGAADALETLEAAGIDRVPRVVARGQLGPVTYVGESVLAGRRPRRVDGALITEVSGFLADLPRGNEVTGTLTDDLSVLATLLPGARPEFERLDKELRSALAAVPSVMTHGDLWAGNVFVHRGRLAGIIDWDGARRDGIPGTDLMHLAVSQRRQKAGGAIGAVWLERPWRNEDFIGSTADYWHSFGLRPDARLLDAVGAAWWAAWLRQALERHERRLNDEDWLATNVTAVLDSLHVEA